MKRKIAYVVTTGCHGVGNMTCGFIAKIKFFLTRTLWGITRNVSSTIKAVFEKCVTVSSQETIVSDISV